MSANPRHIDRGAGLGSFADEVLVRCARCQAPGRVHAEWKPYRWVPQSFCCARCELSLHAGDWAGPVVLVGRRPCGRCGYQWLKVRQPIDTVPHLVATALPACCPECGHTSMVEVTPERSVPEDRAIDPHFGLPLLLKAPSRYGLVWAYNERHLHELQTYIGAKLRERAGSGNGSMCSRLPAWMKRAKNREDILKALHRLASMLADDALRAESSSA